MSQVKRRDFLKLVAASAVGAVVPLPTASKAIEINNAAFSEFTPMPPIMRLDAICPTITIVGVHGVSNGDTIKFLPQGSYRYIQIITVTSVSNQSFTLD